MFESNEGFVKPKFIRGQSYIYRRVKKVVKGDLEKLDQITLNNGKGYTASSSES